MFCLFKISMIKFGMKILLMTTVLQLVLATQLLAQEPDHLITDCSVNFSIEERDYSAYYSIYNDGLNDYAKYRSPFGDQSTVTTYNIAVFEYDYEMVVAYFTGEFRDQMSRIGEFDPQDVFHITQYGIEMNGSTAKAQLILFYNRQYQLLAKITFPSYFPMLCSE